MKTIQLVESGSPVLEVDVPDPRPGPGEIVVRVEAAGICHSDVHYRTGHRPLDTLPVTLGHETAGTVTAVGDGVATDVVGTRVALHYVISCGTCDACTRSGEQFCVDYDMLGVSVEGGYAESLVAPARNAVPIPEAIDTSHAAVMMCSSATSLHALRRGRLRQGETVAVFGVGGLGMSAVQLARALGAGQVLAVDIDEARLAIAAGLGARPIEADDAAAAIRDAGGADVVLDLVGSIDVLRTALASVAPGGRVVSVGLTRGTIPVDPFTDLIRPEAEIMGSNDHLLQEIHDLFDFAVAGKIGFDDVVTGEIPLNADAVNDVMDRMERYGGGVRTVIRPDIGS